MMPGMQPGQRADILPEPGYSLTYDQSAQLMSDSTFQGRVKTACLKFAESIMNELSSVPAHNARLKWASQCFQNPSMVANQIQPPTVMDPAVQSQGSAIPDDQLQGAVENVINQVM